jgi:hypothetical protein
MEDAIIQKQMILREERERLWREVKLRYLCRTQEEIDQRRRQCLREHRSIHPRPW